MKHEERAAMPLAGGVVQHGYQCGMIWGAALTAGAQAYRLFGSGPQAETRAISVAQRLVKAFHSDNGEINCFEITDIDKSSSIMKMIFVFLIKGGTISCMRMSAKYAKTAFIEINSAFSEPHIETPSPPVSCTAMLAKKMGASDMHRVMAAGLAGGIGLCGSACGALGAAIWLMGMKGNKARTDKIGFKSPKIQGVIDRFMKCSNFEFKCLKIAGQKFENIGDHADYLHGGGCLKIIEELAAE